MSKKKAIQTSVNEVLEILSSEVMIDNKLATKLFSCSESAAAERMRKIRKDIEAKNPDVFDYVPRYKIPTPYIIPYLPYKVSELKKLASIGKNIERIEKKKPDNNLVDCSRYN